MTVVGVGGRPSSPPDRLVELVAKALADHGRTLDDLRLVTTIDVRADHPAIARLAEHTGAEVRAFDAGTLARQPVDAPSRAVRDAVGTPSVAEASVRSAGATPLGPALTRDDWVVVVGDAPDLHHHGDAEVEPGMLDFAVNVHAQEPPPFLQRALADALPRLAAYPDTRRATAAVAAAHGIEPECVLLTHGAAEAFTLLARRPWRHPVVVHPQFTEPEAALAAAGHPVERLVLSGDYTLGGARPPAAADLLVVGNPTNPTSRLHPVADIEALAADNRLVVVDEAFLDAVEPVAEPRQSLVRRAATDPRFVVLRSLTKTFSLAGLRIGYVVGTPDRIRSLAATRTPWPVSTLAAVAAEACLGAEGQAYAAAVRAALPGRTAHLVEVLTGLGLSVVEDPRAPFVLARHQQAHELRLQLRDRGIAVRRADTFPGLGPEWLRVAVRDRQLTDRLADALAGRALVSRRTAP